MEVTTFQAQDTERRPRVQGEKPPGFLLGAPAVEGQEIAPRLKKEIFELNYISPDKASLLLETVISEHGSIRSVDIIKDSGSIGKLGASVIMGGYILVTDTAESISNVQEMIAKLSRQGFLTSLILA